MEKQPNLLLWHGVFLLMLLAAIFGIYKAVQAVDYTWRWERIPQYIAYQAEQKQYAEFDGTVVAGTTAAEKGQLFLQDDLDPNRRQAIASTGAQVAEGDTVFQGDTLDTQLSWTAGPIAWGVWVTVKLSLVAGVFAILLGTLAGLARLSPNPALRNLAVTYVELIRGTPLLVQIFIVYFFIGTVLNLDRFTAGVAALAVFTGAYVAEIVRAGISSIHKGQMEAGRSLGLTSAQTMRYVILPQAFKRVLPPPGGPVHQPHQGLLPGLGHLHHGSHQGRARGGQLHLQPVRGVVHRGPALPGAHRHSLLPGASSGGEICAQQLIPLSRLNRSREVQPSPARPAPSRCVVWR
ncbi:amino acid ABC transporter permease [Aeromonas media]|uniref:amino acid ABC transporter permease n=1 Tax=Aeromonas media TaxID=651 RepID=UPI00286FC725|nr:amino acid ABC transporter permease [Aeromonas media]